MSCAEIRDTIAIGGQLRSLFLEIQMPMVQHHQQRGPSHNAPFCAAASASSSCSLLSNHSSSFRCFAVLFFPAPPFRPCRVAIFTDVSFVCDFLPGMLHRAAQRSDQAAPARTTGSRLGCCQVKSSPNLCSWLHSSPPSPSGPHVGVLMIHTTTQFANCAATG